MRFLTRQHRCVLIPLTPCFTHTQLMGDLLSVLQFLFADNNSAVYSFTNDKN